MWIKGGRLLPRVEQEEFAVRGSSSFRINRERGTFYEEHEDR